MPAELCGKIRFQAQHVCVRMRMPAVTPCHIPVGFSYFTSNEKARVEIYLIFVREGDQVVELLKSSWIVVAGAWLKPGPHHVESNNGVAEFVHLGEIGLNILRVPFDRPLHRSFGRNPVRANWYEPLPIAGEIRAIEMHFRQSGDRAGVILGAALMQLFGCDSTYQAD